MDDAFYPGPLIHFFYFTECQKLHNSSLKKRKKQFKGSRKKRVHLIYFGICVNESIKYSKYKQTFRSPLLSVLCDQFDFNESRFIIL